jgi:hypothetical protein
VVKVGYRTLAGLWILSCTLGIRAETVNLIPTPQSVSLLKGSFEFPRTTSVWIAKSPESEFLGRQLADELRRDLAVHLKPVADKKRAAVVLEVITDKQRNGPSASAEGYQMKVAAKRVEVTGNGAPGLFYGVQTLKQLIRANAKGRKIPCCMIKDWPVLRYRGWQDDISRGPIPTLEFLKREIRTMAEYKLNMFTMYTEHVFRLEKHPTIAPLDGLTVAEVRELTAYAKQYHVEIVGNFQSFGHFANILKVPGYEHLGEAGWLISPAKEESYKFLEDVYSEIVPPYESKFFNINCDETAGLGEGASKEMVQKLGIGTVYAMHINRIADILRKYGKTPMMWGDIALEHRDILPKLPKDLVVLSWGYHAADEWDGWIKPFTELGLHFIVCPGVSCWNQVFPDFDNAVVNISNFTRDGARNGALGVLNTTWDDSGENFFSNNWYPLIWGAECAWNPCIPKNWADRNNLRDARLAEFNKMFSQVFYGAEDGQITDALIQLSRLRKNPSSGGMNDANTWVDPAQLSTETIKLENAWALLNDAERIISVLQAKHGVRYNVDALEYAIFAAQKARLMGERAAIAALSADPAVLKARGKEIAQRMAAAGAQVEHLKNNYARLWLKESRAWWLDKNLAKYERLMSQLTTAPFTPIFFPRERFFSEAVMVELACAHRLPITFTLDGSEPTNDSTLYTAPILLKKTTKVRAKSIPPDPAKSQIAEAIFRSLSLPATIKTNMPTYGTYAPEYAIDGDEQSYFWCARQGQANDYFVINLKEATKLNGVRVITGADAHPMDFIHEGVLEVSPDGQIWERVAEFRNGSAEAKIGGRPVSAIRIRLTEGNNAWVVIREILVN